MVSANILQGDKKVVHKATAELAQLLSNFSVSDDSGVTHAFQTLSGFKTVLNSCKTLESFPSWLKEAKLACDRLEVLVDIKGKEWLSGLVKGNSPAHALDKVQELKVDATPAFQGSLDVLKQAGLLEELMKKDTPMPNKDLSDTSQHVKTMLTIASLAIEDIKLFFPDVPNKVADFQSVVEKHMDAVFSDIKSLVKSGSDVIHRFRPGL